MTLPYSHSSSLLCKMQINDQILWDNRNLPVSVLKDSMDLKGVQRFFSSLFVTASSLHTPCVCFLICSSSNLRTFPVLAVSTQKL